MSHIIPSTIFILRGPAVVNEKVCLEYVTPQSMAAWPQIEGLFKASRFTLVGKGMGDCLTKFG